MKYYLLRIVSDPEIKGVKNGLGQVELDKGNPVTAKLQDFFSGLHYWERGKTIPDFEIQNCTASLYKGAKLTDFLDFAPNLMTCPFMISERLAQVFSKFNIQQYFTYPVTLYDKGKVLSEKYYLFCCPLLGYNVINFQESIFYTSRSEFDKERKYIRYNGEEEFMTNYIVGFKMEKLVLNSNFNSSLDFFKTRIGEMYVSEGLKDAIQMLGLTGVNIFDDKEPEIVIETSR